MLSCKEITRLVSQSYDRHLSVVERWNVRVHLWYCLGCRRFRRQMTFLRMATQRLGRVQEFKRLSPAARARIRRGLDDNH